MAGGEEHRSAPLGDVAEALARVARSLEAEPDLDLTLKRIVTTAVDSVPGVECGGVSLVEGGKIETVAASADLVREVDQLQYQLQEGPCLDSIREHHPYQTGDLGRDERWPRFGPLASDRGAVSLLGFRLFTNGETLGALNLYSGRPEAFDDEAVHIGELFAAHAAVALAGSQEQAQLREALRTRDTIAMAKGILIVRNQVDDEQAFRMLVEASQHTNMKLRDVAAWLVREAIAGAGRK